MADRRSSIMQSSKLKEGDWVIVDEPSYMLRGYIERFDEFNSKKVFVVVTEADEDDCRAPVIKDGRTYYQTTSVNIEDCLPLTPDLKTLYMEPGYIENMIDFALITGDKPLFKKLSKQLQIVKKVLE